MLLKKKINKKEKEEGELLLPPPEILQVSRIRLYSTLRPNNSISLIFSLIEEIASIWNLHMYAHVSSCMYRGTQTHGWESPTGISYYA